MKIKRSELAALSGAELAALVSKLQEVEVAQKSRTLERYFETAHEGQMKFHKAASTHRIRYLFGGNRTGKSTAGFVEDIWLATGRHPFIKNWKLPAKGVIILQDFENHAKNILEPKIAEWCPAGQITKVERNQNGAWRKIHFATGSTIDVLSHDQDKKVFEGADYDWAHFDEPPPKDIFNAVWRGLTDRGGMAFLTGTPLLSPWLYQEYLKARDGDPLRWCIIMKMMENAKNLGNGDEALGLKRISDFAETLDADEKRARVDGEFVQMQGLIFKTFSRAKHFCPEFEWPAHWPIWESIDPHPHKPYAVSWVGVTENNKKILLRSGLYQGVIEEIGNQIIYERTQIGITGGNKPRIVRCLIDNSASVPLWQKSNTDPTARRLSVREELENYIGPRSGGPKIEVAPKNVKGKIDIFKGWLKIDDKGTAGFYVFDNSQNERFIYEIENYVWDTVRGGLLKGLKDHPKKIDDDIIDSVLQVALTMPRDSGHKEEPIRTWKANQTWKV